MLPTHALLAAMAVFADPAPTPSLPPPEGPFLVINGEQMKFVHPVATNPYMPAAQSKAPHTDQPKKSGGGGCRGGSSGSGSSGSSGRSGSSGTSASQSLAELAAAIAAAQAAAGKNGSSGGTGGQPTTDPTNPSNPTVLPTPTDQTTAAMMPSSDLFASTNTSTSSSSGTSAVVPDAFDPPTNSPVSTPEPGTILLFAVGASLGGGAAVRKWFRRKK